MYGHCELLHVEAWKCSQTTLHPLQEIQVDIEGQAITENETAPIQWFLKEVRIAAEDALPAIRFSMCTNTHTHTHTQLLPEGKIDVALAAKEITAQKGIGSVVKVIA